MQKIIVIDDEPKAIELLLNYIGRVPDLNCKGAFRNPMQGLNFIQKNKIDIILLDINMPNLTGLSLAKIINPEVNVIFTTAYSEYAVESYNVNATDYLLKPITFERFLQAISKVGINHQNMEVKMISGNFISVKSGYAIHRIDLKNLLYLEKDANYINYHLADKKILGRENISEALQKLSANFIQIHKSYIINSDKIELLENNHVQINGIKLSIGKNYKTKLLNLLQ